MTHNIILTGGGSGGHITPGVALAEEIRNSGGKVLWIGSEGGLESEIVPREGIEFVSNGMNRVSSGTLRTVRRGFGALFAVPNCTKLFNTFKPDAVIGLGGYASVPALVASRLKGVPYFLIEANAIPGSVTRWFAGKSKCVFSNFSEARDYLPKRAIFDKTGIPLRSKLVSSLSEIPVHDLGKGECLLVLGGSQGARALNKIMLATYSQLELEFPGMRTIHLTGMQDFKALADFYKDKQLCEVHAFSDNMHELYSQATVAITRAGAVTLAELALAAIPTLIVPLPHAADNHQAANAEVYRYKKAAQVIAEKDLNIARIIQELRGILHNPSRREEMRAALKAIARPNAAGDIKDRISEHIGSGSGK